MAHKLDPADAEIARVAGRQHGAITAAQLAAAGLGRSAIAQRARRGSLHRLHRGVYAVGHLGPSRERDWAAAVLACGDGAVLSHRAAAALWRLLEPRDEAVDVSTSRRSGRAQRPAIRLHRCRALSETEKTRRLGIPVTTPSRTLADLRGTVPDWLWRRALRQAEFIGLPLKVAETGGRTRSDLESGFLTLCHAHSIPQPEVNVKVGPFTVDFLWPARRLAVETDSYAYHRGRIAFQDDKARDLELRRRGLLVLRFSEDQVTRQSAAVAADVLRALAGKP
jgi:putative AbiEi antitoxin of type IV toxin-antitoxin system/uncharacterized protein DUF559